MISAVIENARASAAKTAKTAALGLGACIALAIGLGFWTLAGWIYLTSVTTALNAAMILGGFYTGLALLTFVVMQANGSQDDPVKTTPEPKADFNDLANAFMGGFSAGSKARL